MPTISARTTTVTLFQGEDFDRELELRKALEAAAVNADNPRRLGDSQTVRQAAEAYDEFVAEAAERGVKVALRSVKRSVWRELVAKHPPRPDNESDASWGFNEEGMADDLVPLSVLTGDEFRNQQDVDDFLDDLSDADYSALYSAAVRLNQAQGPDPKVSLSSRLALTGDETSQQPTKLG